VGGWVGKGGVEVLPRSALVNARKMTLRFYIFFVS